MSRRGVPGAGCGDYPGGGSGPGLEQRLGGARAEPAGKGVVPVLGVEQYLESAGLYVYQSDAGILGGDGGHPLEEETLRGPQPAVDQKERGGPL